MVAAVDEQIVHDVDQPHPDSTGVSPAVDAEAAVSDSPASDFNPNAELPAESELIDADESVDMIVESIDQLLEEVCDQTSDELQDIESSTEQSSDPQHDSDHEMTLVCETVEAVLSHSDVEDDGDETHLSNADSDFLSSDASISTVDVPSDQFATDDQSNDTNDEIDEQDITTTDAIADDDIVDDSPEAPAVDDAVETSTEGHESTSVEGTIDDSLHEESADSANDTHIEDNTTSKTVTKGLDDVELDAALNDIFEKASELDEAPTSADTISQPATNDVESTPEADIDAAPVAIAEDSTTATSDDEKAVDSKPTLADLDGDLADDLDELLENNFDSVDAVLENKTESPAADSQQTEDTSQETPSDQKPDVEASPEPPQESEAAQSPNVEVTDDNPAMDDLDLSDSDFVAPEDAAEAETDVAGDSQDSQSTVEDAPAAPSPDSVAETPESDIETSAENEDSPAADEVESSKKKKQKPKRSIELKAKVMKLAGYVLPPLVVVLSMMNYPLRFLPETARQIVDWIALSVVLWVPIVWLLVLFAGG